MGSAAYKFAFKEKSPKILHRTPVHEKLPVTQKPQAAKRIRVELLNGCGVQGLAMSFSRYRRQHGFDVVETRNYSSFNVKRTLVIDRTSLRLKNAIKVADVLHVSRKFIQPKLNPDLQVEVTVVLGNDFTKLKGFDQIGKD